MRNSAIVGAVLALAGCQDGLTGANPQLDPPTHLTYQVEPSGTPGHPAGIVLRWDDTDDPAVFGWNVYGRDQEGGTWRHRGSTTSNSFHDEGEPQLQYVVTAYGSLDDEGPASNVVTVDERLALARPKTLTSLSLDGGAALLWSDESYQSDPDGFLYYRVYGSSYDLDQNACGSWQLEGTTIAPEFRVGLLQNGEPRCFAVSGISIEGFESLWSPIRTDTPRPDARNVALTARQVTDATAGFRFWRDANGDGRADRVELGRIGAGSGPDVDFSVERDASGRLFLTPVRSGTTIVRYGDSPIGDLTDIDVAPETGYSRTPIEAVPGWGYVFQMDVGDGFYRYGALRVSHTGRDLIIFDWSFQTDPGNPELVVSR